MRRLKELSIVQNVYRVNRAKVAGEGLPAEAVVVPVASVMVWYGGSGEDRMIVSMVP